MDAMERGPLFLEVIAEALGWRDACAYGKTNWTSSERAKEGQSGSFRHERCAMSSNRCFKRLLAAGVVSVFTACSQMGTSSSQPGAPSAAPSAGSACQASDGSMVSDGTIAAKCAVPGQGVTTCPRYTCRRCSNGAWSGEYTCRVP